MVDNDFDKTATYDSSEDDKTGTYDSHQSVSDTYAYDELRERAFKSRAHGIAVGDKINLREREYAITSIISDGTGEAVIYKIEDLDGEIFALKLYFEFANPKEEPNYETLKQIKEIDDPDILKLFDFGARYEHEKFKGRYCYEISQFALGGDLFSVEDFRAKYSPQFVEQVIVHELFKGIKKLHGHKIWHCDLKPANIFYLNESQTDIVIGDYGSAKYVGISQDSGKLNDDRAIRKTSTVKGTEVYLSPEQGRGIVSEKNDFYSFGMILLHLLYPEWLCEGSDVRKVDKNKFERISEHQFDSKPLIKFDERFGRINTLIEGLTLAYNKNRWGQEEVERWLKGEDIPVKYGGGESSVVQPVKLGYAEIRTEKDLIKVIETNPDWYKDLFEDDATYRTVKSWLDSYRDIPSRKEFENLVGFYQPHGILFVKEAILRYFEPERPVKIDMDSFHIFGAADVKKEVDSLLSKLDEIWKITKLEAFQFYLFQLEFSLRQREAASGDAAKMVVNSLIEKLYAVFGTAQQPFSNFRNELFRMIDPDDEDTTFRRMIDMFYAFNPARTFRDAQNQPIETLSDLGLLCVRSESAYSNKHLTIERVKFLEKNGRADLQKLDYTTFVFEIFKDRAESQVELLDITFDALRNYRVSYKFFKSLRTFLSRNGINNDFTSRSASFEIYTYRRGFMKSFETVSKDFIQSVCKKHNIRKIAPDNESQIKEQIMRESWERYFYVKYETWTPSSSTSLDKLQEQVATVRKQIHWRPASLISIVSAVGFLVLYSLFALYQGWIVLDKNTRYLTITKSIKLDGINFAPKDSLVISNESEYSVCTRKGTSEKCYPTAMTAAMFSRQGNLAIDKLGKIDSEFSYARDAFKITKSARLGNQSYPVGSVVFLTTNSASQYCFDIPRKDKCYTRKSACRGNGCNDTIDEYGYVISDYRGKRLFTPIQNANLDGTSFQKGSAVEVAKENPWAYCLKLNAGEKCFLTDSALSRLRQPDVPVISNYGTIDIRHSDFNVSSAAILALFVGGFAFAGAIPTAKQFRLFVLRGRIGTAKFNNMSQSI